LSRETEDAEGISGTAPALVVAGAGGVTVTTPGGSFLCAGATVRGGGAAGAAGGLTAAFLWPHATARIASEKRMNRMEDQRNPTAVLCMNPNPFDPRIPASSDDYDHNHAHEYHAKFGGRKPRRDRRI
jgi:hypothetical protein